MVSSLWLHPTPGIKNFKTISKKNYVNKMTKIPDSKQSRNLGITSQRNKWVKTEPRIYKKF
jgi:hypothetical protein